MGSRTGTTNNPAHEQNLVRWNSETARAAAAKSAESRRRKRDTQAAVALVENRSLDEWSREYKREQLGPGAAAAASLIVHKILNGEINEPRALVSALPVLLDIARLEAGEHTSATLHASLSADASMVRLQTIRAQALGQGPLDTTSSPPS